MIKIWQVKAVGLVWKSWQKWRKRNEYQKAWNRTLSFKIELSRKDFAIDLMFCCAIFPVIENWLSFWKIESWLLRCSASIRARSKRSSSNWPRLPRPASRFYFLNLMINVLSTTIVDSISIEIKSEKAFHKRRSSRLWSFVGPAEVERWRLHSLEKKKRKCVSCFILFLGGRKAGKLVRIDQRASAKISLSLHCDRLHAFHSFLKLPEPQNAPELTILVSLGQIGFVLGL